MHGKIDIAAIGYPAVREAFNQTLALCVGKLSKAEIKLAEDVLDVGPFDEESPEFIEMLADTALYSRKSMPFAKPTKRAVDRIAPKLAHLHDPLKSAIAARLPTAIFSIFGIEEATEPGVVLARDLLDDNRAIMIMDTALATLVAKEGEMLIAGRFIDLGPWHIGFGIVKPLRKSEALAISLAMTDGDDVRARRDTLHELIYPVQLHEENLIMTALEPMIMALALAIDEDIIDMEDMATGFGALLSGEAAGNGAAKKVGPVRGLPSG